MPDQPKGWRLTPEALEFRESSVAPQLGLQYNLPVQRILVVEDEPKVARAMADGLAAEGYAPEVAGDGRRALELATTQRFDLVVLDLMLPGLDGLEVLRAARQAGNEVPVLVVTARDTVSDRVTGLDAGADDYLVKPFAFAELLARVRALLRRGRAEAGAPLVYRDLVVDPATREARRAGQLLPLTAREFDLLAFLLANQGLVVSREMITRDVWNEPNRATSLDNVIDVHIMRLRRKVDRGAEPRLIHTVRGVGFVLREEEP